MSRKPDYAGMARELIALSDEKNYATFLRKQSLTRDHSFLLAAIARSNLHPSARKVLEELLTGKLRRAKHRPTADGMDIKNAFRALRVLDLEAEDWNKRDAAITEAGKQLHCSYSTIEKALYKFEDILKGADPQFLNDLRSAFK
jgi:hypothetical protein